MADRGVGGALTVGARWSLALLVLALFAAACGRSANSEVEVTSNGSPVPSPTPTAAGTVEPTAIATLPPVEPTALPSSLDPDDLRGFVQPIAEACLPGSDRLMPNAPREYRNGSHEGVDMYHLAGCVAIAWDTPVLAMYDGVVVRADHGYSDITQQQVTELAERTASQGFSDAETLDIYRGRQVWIDHGNGVVTRYAHLLSIAEGVTVGAEVERGQVVGGIGESGTPESISAPGTEVHLHYEVRVGDSFLGDGLDPASVRALYERLFSGEEPDAVETSTAAGESG